MPTSTDTTREALEAWANWRGSGFPVGDRQGRVHVNELRGAIERGDALAAALGVAVHVTVSTERVTHGRHCPCTACAIEDWESITGPCGMHGAGCPAVYAPLTAIGAKDDAHQSVASEERRAPRATGLRGLDRGADGPPAPSAKAVEKLNFVQVGHTSMSVDDPQFLTTVCVSCGGDGFLAGAHTERVHPCPDCAALRSPVSPDALVEALEAAVNALTRSAHHFPADSDLRERMERAIEQGRAALAAARSASGQTMMACGHDESSLTSADSMTFCAECAVAPGQTETETGR